MSKVVLNTIKEYMDILSRKTDFLGHPIHPVREAQFWNSVRILLANMPLADLKELVNTFPYGENDLVRRVAIIRDIKPSVWVKAKDRLPDKDGEYFCVVRFTQPDPTNDLIFKRVYHFATNMKKAAKWYGYKDKEINKPGFFDYNEDCDPYIIDDVEAWADIEDYNCPREEL